MGIFQQLRVARLQKRLEFLDSKLTRLYGARDSETRVEEKIRLDEIIEQVKQELTEAEKEFTQLASVDPKSESNQPSSATVVAQPISPPISTVNKQLLGVISLVAISLVALGITAWFGGISNLLSKKVVSSQFFEPELVSIPAGSFEMGCTVEIACTPNEYPVHTVHIPAFAVGKYEVTFAEWDACVTDGVCYKASDEWGRGRQPVINVN